MNIRYDIARGKLHCENCGSDFMPEDFADESATFDACTYTCQSCGAELITTDDTEATAFCSYCGSTSILTGRMENIKKPDGILPFKITREQCREIYLKQAKKAFLVPRWLRDEQCVNSFRAIYMPYWTYNIKASGYISSQSTATERDGDYIVETTTHYKSDEINEDVAAWSHDASNAFADDISEMMDFDEVKKSKVKPFHAGYLSGFYADMADDAAKTHKKIAEDETKARLGGSSGRFVGSIHLTRHELKYMPVWFMSTRKNNRVTYAAINGYTGKIVADFPISTGKFLMIAGIAAAVLAVLLSMILVLRPEPAFWLSAVLMLIGLFFCGKEESKLCDIIEATGQSVNNSIFRFSGKTIRLRSIAAVLVAIGALFMIIRFSLAFFPVCFIAFQIILGLLLTKDANPKTISLPHLIISRRTLTTLILCIAAGLLLLTRDNLTIYGAALFNAFMLSLNCISVFRIHQKIAYRRPPQFNRKGAAYDA